MSGLLCARPYVVGWVRSAFQRCRPSSSADERKANSAPSRDRNIVPAAASRHRRRLPTREQIVQHVLNGQGASAPMLSTAAAERQATSREFLNEAQRTAIREVLTTPTAYTVSRGSPEVGRQLSWPPSARVRSRAATRSKVSPRPRTPQASSAKLGSRLTPYRASLPGRGRRSSSASLHAGRIQSRQHETDAGPPRKIHPEDRVLVIGDTRQHQGVEAGRPFQQMQEAGMQTSKLDQIMRQKDPELLKAVQHLATNETEKGIALLAQQGRVTELASAWSVSPPSPGTMPPGRKTHYRLAGQPQPPADQ